MTLTMGKRELEMGGPFLGELRDATPLRDDPEALRNLMEDEGYLLVRGFHDREKVLAARRRILQGLAENGQIDRSHPLDQAVIAPGGRGAFLGGAKAMTHTPEFLAVVESPELMDFFTAFFGAPAATYDYKWLRIIARGNFTGAHYDIVYMGRGTQRVYTVWTPLGDVPWELGPLCILAGSHRLERIKETYGKMDVDRDHVDGAFSNDPLEMTERYGGKWLSSEFQAGDALIFSMFTMHGSLSNVSDRYRISCDTRYQSADEPIDERWIGENPKAHYAWRQGEMVAMENARKKWGV